MKVPRMSDAGAIAKAVGIIAGWLLSEDGFKEFSKRRILAAKKKEAQRALESMDLDTLRERIAELERMSVTP